MSAMADLQYPSSALHRIRLSQVPLNSTAIGGFAQGNDTKVVEEEPEYQPDKAIIKESLGHCVRYNIVGQYQQSILDVLDHLNHRGFTGKLASHHYKKFLLKLAHALMQFGAPAPMHKIDEQLSAAALFFGLEAQFILLNTVIIAVFRGSNGSPSQTHFIQRSQGLSLAQLRKTHVVYNAVVHDEISAIEGTYQLTYIMSSSDSIGSFWKIIFAFLAGAAICPIGFSGSVADSLVAGSLSGILQWIQLLGDQDVLFIGIFEMTIAISISLTARLLNSITGHIFCYSAISSSGVVLILPGFLVLQGSLELASKNYVTGSTKIVFAIIYSLILGFSLTMGSDLAFLMLSSFRAQRDAMSADLASYVDLTGVFNPTNATSPTGALNGTFALMQTVEPDAPIVKYHYIMNGCYRDPSWSWILQPVPWWCLFFLVPLFVLCLACLNGQGIRGWRVWIMVGIGCCSFAANKVGNIYIYDRGDVVSAIGATVVGILGSIYGHYSKGDALPSMMPGILVLLPAGLSVVGGLSANFRNPTSSVISWLTTGLGMVQVTIGITVGLFASTALIFCFMWVANWIKGRKNQRKPHVGTAF